MTARATSTLARWPRSDDDEFSALDPVQWPARLGAPRGESRFFAEGGFFTPDRKARLIAPEKPAPNAKISAEYSLRLNTGRVRDQWHTMTRSGLSPRLGAHLPEPFVEVHPKDAAKLGLRDGGFARVRSPYGACVLKVIVSEGQRRGSLFAPIHWSGETAFSARVGDVVAPATDPYSGQPEVESNAGDHRAGRLRVSRLFAGAGAAGDAGRHLVVAGDGCQRRRMAAGEQRAAGRMARHAQDMFGAGAELTEYFDGPRGSYRMAAFVDGQLTGALFIGPAEATPHWDTVKALFEAESVDDAQRRGMLSGKSTDGLADPGPVICACFGVGLNVIREAIASGQAANVEDIGKALRAGTNCGSCLPELKKIVSQKIGDDERVAQTV